MLRVIGELLQEKNGREQGVEQGVGPTQPLDQKEKTFSM